MINFGIIGLGLMGREFASAAARWHHLVNAPSQPRITAVCSARADPQRERWFRHMAPDIEISTTDYQKVLDAPSVDAVYIAVPHNLHREIYNAALSSGKHLMGEKPFGIDLAAFNAINEAYAAARRSRPALVVACATQFAFIPGLQRIGAAIEDGEIGRILEVEAGFLHSSDLNPNKTINWKRRVEANGEYGAMGDLGMHALHMPLRAGWKVKNVRAILSNVVTTRPDTSGAMIPCETWDNATLLCEAEARTNTPGGQTKIHSFPLTLKTFRISPGETNTLYLRVHGTRSSYRFSTKNINVLEVLDYTAGGEQNWKTVDIGHRVSYPSITGGIFEFGFSDAILQMWAAFLSELDGKPHPSRFARCADIEEAGVSHRIFTAALESQRNGTTVAL